MQLLLLLLSLTCARPDQPPEEVVLDAFDAQRVNDVERLTELIAAYPAIVQMRRSVQGRDGSYTLLHCAAIEGHTSVVELLLQHGADVNATVSGLTPGSTPLHLTRHPSTVRALLSARPSLTKKDGEGHTVLDNAVRRVAELRLEHSRIGMSYEDVPLACAHQIVSLLVDAGAVYDLATAVLMDDLERIEAVVSSPTNPSIDNEDIAERTSALHAAAEWGREDACRVLLKAGADPDGYAYQWTGYQDLPPGQDGNLPVIAEAVRFPRIVALLLANGAEWKRPIGWQGGASGMSLFSLSSASLLHYAVQGGEVATVELLLEKGLEVDVRDGENNTPLLVAASCGNIPMVRFLMSHGADPQSQDKFGNTPVSCAERLHPQNRVLLRLLKSTDQSTKNSRGESLRGEENSK